MDEILNKGLDLDSEGEESGGGFTPALQHPAAAAAATAVAVRRSQSSVTADGGNGEEDGKDAGVTNEVRCGAVTLNAILVL